MTPIENLREICPVQTESFDISKGKPGLAIVDEVNGFCTPGCGPLAPVTADARIESMVSQTDRMARYFVGKRWPVLGFLDTHEPDRPEPPYPPHCIVGSGDENLVDELGWLATHPDVTLVRKDCINGFVGAIEPTFKGHGTSHNKCVDWVNGHRIEHLLVVGICTDICVMDFVLTMLSARNHALMSTLRDIVVFEPACATYDLPVDAAVELGLPATAAHPRVETHHMGLYFMAARGALIVDRLQGMDG